MNYLKLLITNSACILLLLIIVNATAAVDNTGNSDGHIGIATSSIDTMHYLITSGHIGMAASSN